MRNAGPADPATCCDMLHTCFLVVQNIKKKFPVVLGTINQLIERLHALGPEASIDVDQAALRVTLDVIGLVSSSQGLHSKGVALTAAALIQGASS